MQELSEEERRTLNDLARESLILRILAEISFDMNVCKLEGWDHTELPRKIKQEMEKILNKSRFSESVDTSTESRV